ncbi:MAG: hypothetical protein P8X74_22105, partial [Reinekea sp.]
EQEERERRKKQVEETKEDGKIAEQEYDAGSEEVLGSEVVPDNKRPFVVDSNFKTPYGNTITVARDGDVVVNIGKVNAYIRGGVKPSLGEVKAELSALREFKQTRRKEFDLDPKNEKRLVRLRDVELHNAERSVDMAKTLENAGIVNNQSNNDLIIQKLLQAGKNVTKENNMASSVLSGPKSDVKIEGMYQILPSGETYLNTIFIYPMKAK